MPLFAVPAECPASAYVTIESPARPSTRPQAGQNVILKSGVPLEKESTTTGEHQRSLDHA